MEGHSLRLFPSVGTYNVNLVPSPTTFLAISFHVPSPTVVVVLA